MKYVAVIASMCNNILMTKVRKSVLRESLSETREEDGVEMDCGVIRIDRYRCK